MWKNKKDQGKKVNYKNTRVSGFVEKPWRFKSLSILMIS